MNKYVKNYKSLITTHKERKSGFLNIALRKSKEASYYLNLTSTFRSVVEDCPNPLDLLDNEDLIVSLCDAAGISTKARGYLTKKDIKHLLSEFIKEYLLKKKDNYVDELIERYLLTQGDALGGRMRNIIGNLASEKFTENLIASLNTNNFKFDYLEKKTKNWVDGKSFNEEISKDVKAIRWKKKNVSRMLIYDLTVPIVKKNIDIVLFSSFINESESANQYKNFISNHNNYTALGELKGGIDPAGADEHWKTANTALQRIRSSFSKKNIKIKTFFVGAAIESAMAEEIYEQCSKGFLANCANLTKNRQLSELCKWIINL